MSSHFRFLRTPQAKPAQPAAARLEAAKAALRPLGDRAALVKVMKRATSSPAIVPGVVARPRIDILAPQHPRTLVPNQQNVHGDFWHVARRFERYAGISGVPLVPFEAYYADYNAMRADQMAFYFSWRTRVRQGETPPTSLSYVFVYIYELLHTIGAETDIDAALQIEAVWRRYRRMFPKLDTHVVRWVADLYAGVQARSEVVKWFKRAAEAGASLPDKDAVLLLADPAWSSGDYAGLSDDGLHLILDGVDRSARNAFYAEHNKSGWVDVADREVLGLVDNFVRTQSGHDIRRTVVMEGGMRPVRHDAFAGALYSRRRRVVTWGEVPDLSADSPTLGLCRCAVRYVENRLRKSRKVSLLRKGIEVELSLKPRLDLWCDEYLNVPRPKPTVVINHERVRHLTHESEQTRARLLAGLEVEEPHVQPEVVEASVVENSTRNSGLSDLEYSVLQLVSEGKPQAARDMAVRAGTSLLLVIEGINAIALESEYGDIAIDATAQPPVVFEEAHEYVGSLLQSAR